MEVLWHASLCHLRAAVTQHAPSCSEQPMHAAHVRCCCHSEPDREIPRLGLPACQEDDVWDYWGYCGDIESLDLMRFLDTGRFKGICFITFKTVSNHTHHSLAHQRMQRAAASDSASPALSL